MPNHAERCNASLDEAAHAMENKARKLRVSVEEVEEKRAVSAMGQPFDLQSFFSAG